MAGVESEQSVPCVASSGLGVVGEQGGSQKKLRHRDYHDAVTWAFHDGVEIGPTMLSRIAKKTGLKPGDL